MADRNTNTIARSGATYRHFKGSLYKVVTIAIHSETAEPLVIYAGNDGTIWARPRHMFEDGRFQRVSVDLAATDPEAS